MARVLLAEDDDHVRGMLIEALESAGHEVEEVATGRDVMSKYRQSRHDVVILDIVLPEKEGLELITELTGEFPDVKIVAISGGGRVGPETYLKLAKRMGAVEAYSKPMDVKALIARVGELASG